MFWLLTASHPVVLWALLIGSLAFGLTRSADAARVTRWWGGGLLCAIAALIFVISPALGGYAVFLMAGIIALGSPFAVIALGMLLGGWLAALRHRGQTTIAAVLAILIIALPAGAMWLKTQAAIERRAERTASYAEFQRQTIEGTFASVPVRVPASPDLETVHRTPSAKYKTARTYFWQAGGTLQTGRDPVEGAPDFTELVMMSSRRECDVPEPPRGCLTSPRKLAEWCARRPELLASPWCNRPRHRLELRVRPKLPRPSSFEWPLTEDPPIAVDALGDPVRLRCIEKTPPSCEIIYALSTEIVAEASLYQIDRGIALEEAREMHAYVARLWSAMTAAP